MFVMEGKKLIRFLAGFLLIVSGLFLAVGIISYVVSGQKTSLGGDVGDYLADRGLSLFGWASLWFPLILVTAGIGAATRFGSRRWLKAASGFCLGFAGLLILLGLPFLAEGAEGWELTQPSSGAVGLLLTGWLHRTIGWAGLLASGGFCIGAAVVLLGGSRAPAAIKRCGRFFFAFGCALGRLCRAATQRADKYVRTWWGKKASAERKKVPVERKKAPAAGKKREKKKAREGKKRNENKATPQRSPEIVAPEGAGPALEQPARPSVQPPVADRTSGSGYRLPPWEILHQIEQDAGAGEEEEVIRERGEILEQTLQEFNIEAEVVRVQRGPVVTMYEMALSPGTKVSKVESLDDDLAIALKAPNVRIVAPIPGKSTIGIEVPNAERETVILKELFAETGKEALHMDIPLFLGKDTAGSPLMVDLAMAPHLLIAGATGSGKSVSINSIICSIVMTRTPDEVQLLLVDPKSVEFSDYQRIPHLICPVVTDMKKAAGVLQWACKKMDERFAMLSRTGVRNIGHYNRLGEEEIVKRLDPEEDAQVDDVPFYMPHVVIIIDELGELMLVAAKEVESSVIRLSQKARAVGIHLICATQRPSADVITGLIKANLPVKIAFQVSSKINSRVILDRNGAELLLGRGDMLMIPPGSSRLIRAQGTFVSQAEAIDIVNFVSSQQEPQFKEELKKVNTAEDGDRTQEDELYDEAARIVLETQRGSVSLLQRRLAIGYSRAARLIDMIADAGLIGPYKGSQAREVYMTLEEWENARSADT